MKRLPIVLLFLITASFVAFRTMGTGSRDFTANPPSEYAKILKIIGQMLEDGHYSPQKLDDEFSRKIFKKYINSLDEEKVYYLQSDIDSMKVFETTIDDEIKGTTPVAFFLDAGKKFNNRVEQSYAIATEILSKPFDFSIDEPALPENNKLNYCTNQDELKERWRKKLKFMALERYADLLDIREKNKNQKDFVVKSDAELEQDARTRVKKIIDRTVERFRNKFSDDDKFNLFVNDITTTMDPHTEFFPPVDKRYFDEEMSGHFYGIGASLQYDEGNIKISSIISGSPAFKSNMLAPGDIIMKVAQGKDEPIELTGFSVTDAVKVIRGKKGTEVRLTVKKTDGTIKLVSIIRDEIIQEEIYAHSAVVKSNGYRIGFIYLPEFYADFDHPNGRRCYVDVAKELVKLKEQNVDGIVIDLRNNGGGSLYDVVQMAGLFIDEGPIVQVKDRDEPPSVLRDKDKSVLYSGPLAVMVNEFSASASEIFAAAIQDYNRGIIIGSTSTYGKGTVQRNIGLDPDNSFSSNSDLGTLKLTLQKFYRINGGSTQLKGVSSDIVLADNLEYLKVREKDDSDALQWDEIGKAKYAPWKPGYDLKRIVQMSNERLKNDNTFNLLKQDNQWLSKENEVQQSLSLDKYLKEKKSVQTTVEQIQTLLKLKNELDVSSLPGDADKLSYDKGKLDRFNQWMNALKKDIYLDQAVKVMDDMINQENLVKAKTGADTKKAF